MVGTRLKYWNTSHLHHHQSVIGCDGRDNLHQHTNYVLPLVVIVIVQQDLVDRRALVDMLNPAQPVHAHEASEELTINVVACSSLQHQSQQSA